MPRLPLEGVRILDLTEVWAGPMAASYLGDMGAEVIKVESFPRAPITRHVTPQVGRGYPGGRTHPTRPWDSSSTHNVPNRNKYGIALDISSPRGAAILKDLVRVSDALMDGYSAGTLQKMGLGYSALKELNPGLVMVSMPGWGVEGPYKGYVTLGNGPDAYSGHFGLRGYPDMDPTHTPSVVHSDAIGAVTVPFAILTALHYRSLTGKGQWVDLSQAEAFIPHLAAPIMDYVMNKRLHSPIGNRDHTMAPHGCYRCRGEDAWMVLAVSSDEEWRSLCAATGHEEWAMDERFADAVSRYRHQDELDALIQEWALKQDKMEVMRLLQEAGVPAAAVLNEAEVYENPHLKARDFFLSLKHSVIGAHVYTGFAWKFGKTPSTARLAPNALGEHSDQVYGRLLGMGPGEIGGLERDRIIGHEYPQDAGLDPVDRSP